MRFIQNGPDIPDQLIIAQEKGEVVFFCGAGISRDAGLPLFEGLVKKAFREYGKDYDAVNRAESRTIPLEEALRKIERQVPGGREDLRKTIWKILQPKKNIPTSKSIHKALLDLAKEKEEYRTRIVTTNFDRLFEKFRSKNPHKPEQLIGAKHRTPRKHQWNGIVYLHGLLPDENYESHDIDYLILTSSDFGQAYLSHGWAARFVTEMFKNYSVCFVGYSLGDPVMRYLTEAVAADEAEEEGNIPPKRRYALIEYADNQIQREWIDRGITPIVYNPANNHRLFKQTLLEWRDYYVGGLQAKETIVRKLYQSPPPTEKPQGGYKNQPNYDKMMMVLRYPEVTHYFATINPRPPFEWLYLLRSREFDFGDLLSFGHDAIPKKETDKFTEFSLLEPKVKFQESSYFYLYEGGEDNINPNVENFYRWIVRHLDNPQLALEIAQSQAMLNNRIKFWIEQELLEERGTKANPDPPIPPVMRQVWRMFLNDEIRTDRAYPLYALKWHNWKQQYKIEGCLNLLLQRELQTFLKPKLDFQPRREAFSGFFGGSYEKPDINEVKYIGDFFLVDIDINVSKGEAGDIAKYVIREEISLDEKLFYIDAFCDAIIELFEFGDDLFEGDLFSAYYSQILIEGAFEGSKDFFATEWHYLIGAIINLWHQLERLESSKAISIFDKWSTSRYIFFHRLALTCLKESSLFDTTFIFNYLIAENGRLLKEERLLHQVFPLLEKYATKFTPEQR